MARPRWSRYTPPRDLRTEDGARVAPPTAERRTATERKPAERKPTERKPTERKPTGPQQPGTRSSTSTKVVWAGLGAAALLVGAVVAGVATRDDEDAGADVDTSLLDERVLTDALERAAVEVTSGSPTTVRVSNYYLEVEFFDPTAQEVRTYRQDPYNDGFSIEVRPNEYADYRPTPIDLAEVDPAVVVALTEDAMGRVDDVGSFTFRAEDGDADALRLIAEARSEDYDETVTLTADAEGRVVEEDVD